MTKVAIVGSCVTRDAFDMFGPHFEVSFYCMHTCVPSIMSAPVELPQDAAATSLSPFFLRNLKRDFSKTLFDELENIEFDVLVIDFVEERYDLFEIDGALISSSYVLSLTPDYEEFVGRTRRLKRMDLPPTQFAAEFKEFGARLASIVGERPLILNHLHFADSYVQNGNILFFDRDYVKLHNEILDSAFNNFIEGAPRAKVIDATVYPFRAGPEHRWGCQPFHYEPVFYKFVIDQLAQQMTPHLQGRVMSPYERWDEKVAESLTNDFVMARAFFIQREFGKCMEFIESCSHSRGLTANDCHYYGRCLLEIGHDLNEAERLLSLACDYSCDELVWCHLFLGVTQSRLNRVAEAAETFTKALAVGAASDPNAVGQLFYAALDLLRNADLSRVSVDATLHLLSELWTKPRI